MTLFDVTPGEAVAHSYSGHSSKSASVGRSSQSRQVTQMQEIKMPQGESEGTVSVGEPHPIEDKLCLAVY